MESNQFSKNTLLFSDKNGKYILLDYNRGHGQLVFRRSASDVLRKNYDIYMKGVYALNIQIQYNGLEIYWTPWKEGLLCTNPSETNYIFQLIDSAGVSSYLDACVFGVYENDLAINETSIGDFMWSDKNKLLFSSNEGLKSNQPFIVKI